MLIQIKQNSRLIIRENKKTASIGSIITPIEYMYFTFLYIGTLSRLPENSIQTLTSLATDFDELSDTCLLVLHLEVRVHCFHYLHSIWKGSAGAQLSGGPDSTEPHVQVSNIVKD